MLYSLPQATVFLDHCNSMSVLYFACLVHGRAGSSQRLRVEWGQSKQDPYGVGLTESERGRGKGRGRGRGRSRGKGRGRERGRSRERGQWRRFREVRGLQMRQRKRKRSVAL